MRHIKETPPHGSVDLGDGVHAADRFEVVEEHRLMPYRVTLAVAFDADAGRYVCESIRVERGEGGPPVTTDRLRQIPVAELVRWGAEQTLMRSEKVGANQYQLKDALAGVMARISQGYGPNDEVLAGVAALYRLAFAVGQPPVKYVSEALVVPRSTVGRWISKARERGFLGPAEPGKAGEQKGQ